MTTMQPAADETFAAVESPGAMPALLEWLAPAARVAIDIEADSLYHYRAKVCLVQLTARGRNFLVDPLAKLDLAPLLEALAARTLIIHGADYDLSMLRRSFGFRPGAPVIDTMIAARLLGYEKLGLGALVERFFGRTISKSGQKSDWSRRPLAPAQVRYAVDDTRYLEPLADRLLAELGRLGRGGWLEEWGDAVVEATASDPPADPEREWRIKGVRDLTPAQASLVRALWYWREGEAERADRPPFKVLGNDRLMEVAEWADRHRGGRLGHIPRLPRDFRGRRLASLREAIESARRLPRSEWPAPRLPRVEKPKIPQKPYRRLCEAVDRLGAELGVEPSVIAPRAALEEIARLAPTDEAGLRRAGGLLRYQASLLLPIVRGAGP